MLIDRDHLKDSDQRPQQAVEVLSFTHATDVRIIRYFLAELATEQIHAKNTTRRHTHTQVALIDFLPITHQRFKLI